MSIKVYTGLPGSGKTYRVVKELLDDYQDKYCIIHNIDGLKPEAFNPDSYVKSFSHSNNELAISVQVLFQIKTQRRIVEELKEKYDKPVLMVIDECDKLGFDKPDDTIKEWLSMHRHIGQDILLITQSVFNIHKSYNHLIELEIQAKKGFVFTSFIYSWKAQGSRFKTDRLKKENRVFDAYKSFEFGEIKKKTTSLWKLIFFVGIVAVVGMVYTVFFMFPNHVKKIDRLNEKRMVKAVSEETFSDSTGEGSQSPSKADLTFHYAGVVNHRVLLNDQYGNLYRSEVLQSATLFKCDNNIRTVTLLNPDTGPVDFKNVYVIDYIDHNSGASRQRETDREREWKKEIWVMIE